MRNRLFTSCYPRSRSGAGRTPIPIFHIKRDTTLDGFKPTDADKDDGKRTWSQSVGEFLIDRDGIVRWLRAEGASAAGYCAKFPPQEALVSAALSLTLHRQGE